MENKMKKLLTLAGVTAAVGTAYLTVRQLVSRTLVREALDRDEPKIMVKMKDKISAGKVDEELLEKSAVWRDNMEKRPHEVVNMESFDGTRLVGHWFEVPNAKRVLIAMHGWRSGWSRDFCGINDFWLNNECSVLYPEQRGQGDSDGEYMGFGLIERYDCLEWIKWLNQHKPSDLPVYLVGISMGATTVLMTAGFRELPENVHGVIADCGFTSPHAIWKHVAEKNLKIPFERNKKLIDRLCQSRIEMDADSYSTVEAMKNVTVPVFFIHGLDDHFVPPWMTKQNFEVCASPKKLLTVSGADHGLSYLFDRETYERMTLEFFAENDA